MSQKWKKKYTNGFDEEEKLVKFLKRIDQELKIRKEKFALYNVASLSQYEQKSGEKLPAILTIFDGFDTIKDTPLEEAIESMINRILTWGSESWMLCDFDSTPLK